MALKLEGREITVGLKFPEGPIVMRDGSVLVVEIAGGTLTRVSPDGEKSVIAELGGGPNGAAIGPDEKCYVCNNGGFNWLREADGFLRPVGRANDYQGGRIERVDLQTGAVEIVYTHCDGEPLKGPNDIVFDGGGGFWFTDHGKTYDRLMDRGAVFYARADGSLIKETIFPMLMHYVTNIEIDLDGDRAKVHVMFYNPMLLPGMADLSYCGGYYHHEVVRTSEGWKSARLVEQNVWFKNHPSEHQPK